MDSNKQAIPTITSRPLRNQRSEDFASVYANNVGFEASSWDLKIIFGQLDQAAGIVDQHTAITIPWSLVKLALFHLRAQIAAHEIVYGKIMLSPDVLPPEPPPLPDELKDSPAFQQVYNTVKKMRDEFIESLQLSSF